MFWVVWSVQHCEPRNWLSRSRGRVDTPELAVRGSFRFRPFPPAPDAGVLGRRLGTSSRTCIHLVLVSVNRKCSRLSRSRLVSALVQISSLESTALLFLLHLLGRPGRTKRWPWISRMFCHSCTPSFRHVRNDLPRVHQ